MDTKLAQEFARKKVELDSVTAREKQLKAELKELGEELLEQMLDEDDPVQNITVKVGTDDNGNPVYKNIYVKRTIWAGFQDSKEALIEALKATGYEDIVAETFSYNTLSAIVREKDDGNLSPEEILEKFPKGLADHLKVTEKFDVVARNT